jgi:hypothetical protein
VEQRFGFWGAAGGAYRAVHPFLDGKTFSIFICAAFRIRRLASKSLRQLSRQRLAGSLLPEAREHLLAGVPGETQQSFPYFLGVRARPQPLQDGERLQVFSGARHLAKCLAPELCKNEV